MSRILLSATRRLAARDPRFRRALAQELRRSMKPATACKPVFMRSVRAAAAIELSEKLTTELGQYGYRILPDGRFFSIGKDAPLGVIYSKKRGKPYYHSVSGTLLASGMNPIEFVKKFWYATKRM